jgi:ribosomal protein S20
MTEAAERMLFCVFVKSVNVFLNSLTMSVFSSILHRMPITRGAKKTLKQDKKRHEQNLVVKNAVKKSVKLYRAAPSVDKLPGVFSMLDTAGKKNIYHANKISRLKSRLTKLLGRQVAAPAGEAKKAPAKAAKAPAKKIAKKVAKKTAKK